MTNIVIKFRLPLMLLITMLWFSLIATAQETAFLSRAVSALEKQPGTEKVYLHLNKSSYNFGDTIWYKAYTVIGQHHQFSALSGVLYVDFHTSDDSLVSRQLIQLHFGTGWGDIPLPHNLKPGYYRLRAYTNWMRNFDNTFFDRQVQVGGVAPLKPVTASYPDVQFFPESGYMVAGVRSRIAFKAVSSNGLGIAVNGIVTDSKGDTAAILAVQHLGMGEFVLTPKPGENYIAHIQVLGRTSLNTPLPQAQSAGYVLTINNGLPDSVYLKVAVNDALLAKEKGNLFYITGQSNGKIFYTAQAQLQNLNYSARVEKSRFPSGIVQFTLFNHNGMPVAERLVYEQGSDTLQLHVDGLKSSYTVGQQAKLWFTALNSKNTPATGSFSITVVKDGQDDENTEGTILNNLLFTSDIKGYVEQPNYYFTYPSDQTRADIDLLLRTQGYRRFEWKKVLDNAATNITYLPERSLQLNGIAKTLAGKPAIGAKILLAAMGQNKLMDTTADDIGRFSFENLLLRDTNLLILRVKTQKGGDNVRLKTISSDYPALAPEAVNNIVEIDSLFASRAYKAYQKLQSDEIAGRGKMLKQVNIRANAEKKPNLARSSNPHGGGNADQVIMGDQLDGCPVLSQSLDGKAIFIHFTNGVAYNPRSPGPMSVIIDGNIKPPNYLDEIAVNDIYSVEVLRTGAARSVYGTSIEKGGALIITLKNGDEKKADTILPQGLLTFPFVGYTTTQVFYSPKYSPDEMDRGENKAIYWNPNILTIKDGKADINYSNFSEGNYRLVIEGIDDDGNLGRQVYRYKVK